MLIAVETPSALTSVNRDKVSMREGDRSRKRRIRTGVHFRRRSVFSRAPAGATSPYSFEAAATVPAVRY
jgi:hypothetical protein